MENIWKESFVHRSSWNRETNRAIYETLKGLTDKALAKDRGSWFGSLIGLLNHLIVTDIHWLDRFRPLATDAEVLIDGRLDTFSLEWKPLSHDFDVLSEGRAVIDSLLCEWFTFYPETSFGTELDYEDSGGEIHTVTDYRAFDFLLMHENYHRGQISQILDEIGLPHSFADNGSFEELK